MEPDLTCPPRTDGFYGIIKRPQLPRQCLVEGLRLMAVSMDSGGPSPRMALKAMPCMFQYCILNALSYILEDTWVHPAEIDTSQLRPHHQPYVLVPWFFAAAEFNNLLTV